jgi:putative transposase
MNEVFKYTGYTKQAFHQKRDRVLLEREQHLLLLPLIEELRLEHPGVAVRQLYLILRPEHIGRDKFESLCFEHGFKLPKRKAYKRTTDSTGVIRFPNLIEGREFTAINQAWVSDITYFQIGERVYYITFIMDLFSRKIVGYSVSKRLLTDQTTSPALRMALAQRKPGAGVIFHSDGGGQYYCKTFLKLTEDHKIKNSMCDVVFENPHAERINGTIKNQYLKGYKPYSYESLTMMTARAVYNYNNIRPHKSLKQLTPAAFEQLKSADGSSSSTDNFCTSENSAGQHQKNYQLPMRSIKPLNNQENELKKRSTFFRL